MRVAPRAVALLIAACLAGPAAANEAAVEAMREYMEFSEYEAGIILPQQIDAEVFAAVLFVDTRDAGQFAEGSIPGAINIDWRETLARIDEIPADRKVVLYCNTGSLSAQAAFALRVAGRDNVVVLQSGIEGWRENAAWKP